MNKTTEILNPSTSITGNVFFGSAFSASRIKTLPSKKAGRYRLAGTITINDNGIKVEGRHLKPVGVRWAIGLVLFIPGFFLGFGIGGMGAWWIVNSFILTKEDVFIPWDDLLKYASKKTWIGTTIIGLEFNGPQETSPCVFSASNSSEILKILQEKSPNKEAI